MSHQPLVGDEFAYEDEDVEMQRENDGRVTLMPRSMRNAPEPRRLAVRALMVAAAEYEAALLRVGAAVEDARDAGASWDLVGWATGTTGSGARKRWMDQDGEDL